MIVMPPIEWPTSTTGPRGTRASSTAARSRASCSIVECSAVPAAGRRRGRAGRRRPAGRRAGARWRWPARRPGCGAGRSTRPSTACSRARRRRSAARRRADLLDRQQDAVVGLHQRRPVGARGRGAERVVRAQLGGRWRRRGGSSAAHAPARRSGWRRPRRRFRPPRARRRRRRCRRRGAGRPRRRSGRGRLASCGLARHQTAPAEPT